MKWLERFLDFYVNGSVHVSFAVIAFLLISAEFLNIFVSEYLIYFVFFSTISYYNLLKYGSGLLGSLRFDSRPLAILSFSLLCLFLAFLAGLRLPVHIIPVVLVLIVLIVLYAAPIFPSDKNLRSLGLLKVIIVSVSWSIVTVILPVVAAGQEIQWDVFILSLQRFVLVLAMMIPFEIRDMYIDPPEIKTIPRRLGIKYTKWLGVFLAFLSFVLVYLKDDIHPVEISSRIAVTVLLSWLILRTPTYPAKYYASFWVEAIPIFWILMLYSIDNSIS